MSIDDSLAAPFTLALQTPVALEAGGSGCHLSLFTTNLANSSSPNGFHMFHTRIPGQDLPGGLTLRCNRGRSAGGFDLHSG
jgi:hypothetical protein